MFLAGIHGRLAPVTMMAYPGWEMNVIHPILQENSKQSKKLDEKVNLRRKTHIIDYIILIILTIAVIVYRVVHTMQMIFVELSAHIDRGIPPSQSFACKRKALPALPEKEKSGMVLVFVDHVLVSASRYFVKMVFRQKKSSKFDELPRLF